MVTLIFDLFLLTLVHSYTNVSFIIIIIVISISIPIFNVPYSTVFFTLYVGLCMVKFYFIIISLRISFPVDEYYDIVVSLDREI
jgi:TRAP-type C4-dicarboxylate transport system permease small subunit